MKKSIKFFAFIVGLSIVVASCSKKDELLNNDVKNNDITFKNGTKNTPTVNRGILAFSDTTDINSLAKKLEEDSENYWNSIVKRFENLSDEEFDSICDLYGYDEDNILRDFEEYITDNGSVKFKSLFKQIEMEEAEWLNNDTLDFSKDPDDHVVLDETYRVLLNEYGEVITGNSIYKVYSNGATFEVLNLDFDLLDVLRQYDEDDITNADIADTNLIVHYLPSGSGKYYCTRYKRESSSKRYGSRKIKWVTSVWRHFWDDKPRVMAKTKNYKKKWYGWKKYRTYCVAGIQGSIYDPWCSYYGYLNYKQNQGREKQIKRKRFLPTPLSKIKTDGSLQSYHYGAGGITLWNGLD